MKIGLAVQVLPLCNPLGIAEEAATVDQISHGRLVFGGGRSGMAETYEAYGVPYAESRERSEGLDRAGDVLPGTIPFIHRRHGHAAAVPETYAANSHCGDTFATIGHLGLPIFLAVRHEDARRIFEPQIATYREAYSAAGHPGKGQVFLAHRGISARRYKKPAMTPRQACCTPDSESTQLRALQDELELDGVLLELNCGGQIPIRG